MGKGKSESPPGAVRVKWDETGPRRNPFRRISVTGSKQAAVQRTARTARRVVPQGESLSLYRRDEGFFYLSKRYKQYVRHRKEAVSHGKERFGDPDRRARRAGR